jgi:hypothetical protein
MPGLLNLARTSELGKIITWMHNLRGAGSRLVQLRTKQIELLAHQAVIAHLSEQNKHPASPSMISQYCSREFRVFASLMITSGRGVEKNVPNHRTT